MRDVQFSLDIDGRIPLIREIDARLRKHYPDFPPRYLILDPVSQLVMSLLGTRTYTVDSRAAHSELLHRFNSWSEVRDADVTLLEMLIRRVTMADLKARRIKSILTVLSKSRGYPCLTHLNTMSVENSHAWLEAIEGIGPKIAAAVLNTSTLRKRSLVIDTHHKRILIRLGLLSPGSDFRKAYRLIMPLMPKDWTAERIDEHHMLFKRLGQRVCQPVIPLCDACPLQPLCRYAKGSRLPARNHRVDE